MYSVMIACSSYAFKNQVFNVETSLNMSLVFDLIKICKKKNYSCTIKPKKAKHRPVLSLDEALKQIQKLRFYKTEVVYDSKPVECVCPLPSIVFPAPVKIVRCWSHENVNITFFELECTSDLVSINFDALKKAFEDRGLDLCKSKTEGVWYTHNDIDISMLDDTHLDMIKTTIKYEYTKKERKVEL